jgi:Xaa-Pro aminopeptidase
MEERGRFEDVGGHYDKAMMLETRARTRRAMASIAAGIKPGMLEEDAMDLARSTLKSEGMLRGWHAIHVRFGENTLKQFGTPSEPGVKLRYDDIFFIDIGPVWREWEGDAGQTYVVGKDPEMHRIARDVKDLFSDVRSQWKLERLTGVALYEYASRRALDMGWRLNLEMNGHRLADFPHAAIHKGALAAAAFTPSADLWVLEIQIRHPTRAFSAFYEDLLLDDAER